MSDAVRTYWNTYFGRTPEAHALVEHIAGMNFGTVEVHAVFADLGLDGLSGNYTDTEIDGFGDAFLVVAALAVLVAETRAAGSTDLGDVGGPAGQRVAVHVESKENTQISTALKYFALSPDDHAAEARFDEDELTEFADLCEQLRGRLD
ncbi:MAG: hypothetical protein GX570_06260 [Corynebacterium marinum]|uniref:Uncharacterized protein n=1 Tax=Corynebacterium marinum TaxID=349751 RepID=A0A847HB04_9CORY|nr:hypothetical protein [Corynebacterium marinum]